MGIDSQEMNTKKCPYCMCEIPIGVKKCKHCGEWINNPVQPVQPSTISTPLKTPLVRTELLCNNCNSKINPVTRICTNCGKRISNKCKLCNNIIDDITSK